jgi:hypothetical protein
MNNSFVARNSLGVQYDPDVLPRLFCTYINPSNQSLHTTQYFERTDFEIKELDDIMWSRVGRGATEPSTPTTSVTKEQSKIFWVSWREGEKIFGMSNKHEKPVSAQLKPNSRIIYPTLVNEKKEMEIYLLGPKGGGWSLGKYTFTVNEKEDFSVDYVDLISLDNLPLLATVRTGFAPEVNKTFVALLFLKEDEVTIDLYIFQDGELVSKKSSEILVRYRIIENQTFPMHLMKDHSASVAFVAFKEGKGYQLLEWKYDRSQDRSDFHPLQNIPLETNTLHGAGTFYFKADERVEMVFILDVKGNLFAVDYEELNIVREGVSLDYTFPFLLSSTGIYEATFNSEGKIELVNP